MYIVLQDNLHEGMGWKLSRVPLVIGRGRGCAIRITDTEISRQHAKIWIENGEVKFQDLGSRNSTLINGEPAATGTLRPGDILGAGSASFRIAKHWEPKRSPGNDAGATPVTLSFKLASYLRGVEQPESASLTHRTVHELHDLFHFGRMLGSVESVRELTQLLSETFRDKFDPFALWIAWRYADDQALVWEQTDSISGWEEAPTEYLRSALDSREGLIKPSIARQDGKTFPQTTMAVPLVHADRSLGGIVIVGRHPGRTYAEDDLHFALSMAAIAAPHVRAVRHAEQLKRDNEALLARAGSDVRLLGESPAIVAARDLLMIAGNSNLPVLILGETGTGKEIAARMLHEASPRHEGPYITVNCAAIPDHLFESEFFGYEKGAFTGATSQYFGRFAEAHGGTLFLDEIGDLSLDNQARILRAIETNTFQRIGNAKPIKVDVRIISATNKRLAEPQFRLDLLHRLNGVVVNLPPLRERPEDIPILANHFLHQTSSHGLERVTRITPSALQRLQQYAWPGNVRELKAMIDRLVLFARDPEIDELDISLPEMSVQFGDSACVQFGDTANTAPVLPLADVERRHIRYVVDLCEGNIAKAARLLRINRATVYKRIAGYTIE